MKPSTAIVPLAAAAASAQSLASCRAACRGGTAAMEAFCRVIPILPVRAACWPISVALKTPGAQTACANWCFWAFGDGRKRARAALEGRDEEISLAHDMELAGIDFSEFIEADEAALAAREVTVEWTA